jgi:hypothetical protein
MDITASFDGEKIIEDIDPVEDETPSRFDKTVTELSGFLEAPLDPVVVEAVAGGDPSDEEILEFAEATGTLQVQDENIADGEDLADDSYARYLAVLDKACPLPEDFPTAAERTELMNKYGRLRIRRLAPGEAYLVRPVRRIDMPTYYRIQQGVTQFEDSAEAEIWFENELASTFCLYPEVTEEALMGTGMLGMGGTVEMIARDIMGISNLVTNTDVGMVEDL